MMGHVRGLRDPELFNNRNPHPNPNPQPNPNLEVNVNYIIADDLLYFYVHLGLV